MMSITWSGRLVVHTKVYQLLIKIMGEKSVADTVFTTQASKVTHLVYKLEKLAEHFGNKSAISPTLNMKQKQQCRLLLPLLGP